jgi:hypothetical protein
MDYARISVPRFYGENYEFWSKRMKTYIQTHRFDVWREVVYGYKVPATPSIDKDGNKIEENDFRDRNSILNGLTKSMYAKFLHCDSAK